MALRNLRKTGERWLGTPYNGILAAQILADTATGDDGPGALYNEAQDAQYAGKRLRLRMLNWPTTGTLRVEENGAYDANGLPAGTNIFSYAFYVDGVLQSGTADLTIVVGAAPVVNATASGATLNATSTLSAGSASNGAVTNASAPGTTLNATAGITAGSATGGSPDDAFAPGASLNSGASLVTGGATRVNGLPVYSTVSIDTLLDFVMPKTPKLTVELARFEIRQAAIRFCRQSGWDQRNLATFETIIGSPFYLLNAPTDTAISELISVVIDGEVPGLTALRPPEIPANADTRTESPQWYCSWKNGSLLQLIYSPDAIGTVFVKASVEPTRTCLTLSEDLINRWGEEIAFGALEYLLVMPKKPWTDVGAASYYKMKFDEAVIDAISEVDRGFAPAVTRTRPCFGLR